MIYPVKMPWLLRQWYGGCLWNLDRKKKTIYLSFDDGPHPRATPFVLEELARYGAKATFFCIGKNVLAEPEIYQRILAEGHRVGNHTHTHRKGSKTADRAYFLDIAEAARHIDSQLFRPPYGRIRRRQLAGLRSGPRPYTVVMWDVLSGDFDQAISGERCAGNVITHAKEGSIVVFHDSGKAFPRLAFALPRVLEYFSAKGFAFESIG